MAKKPKSSTKDDDTLSRVSKTTVDESITATTCIENTETLQELDLIETKSVAESDSGRLCGDVLANFAAQSISDPSYSEPSLSDIIVVNYEGEKSNSGHFEGYGEAQFVGGNKYAGFFLGGVMHGKGKYFWADGSVYDGDINNNQISGDGRYEWPDESFYEGEVSNGLRHGVGVFKSPKHNVSYSGQWYLGKRHGRGIMHYSEHSWYEGDWVNNARHGWGVRRYHTGNVYEGQWVNDKRHGEGTMRWLTTDESYSGIWENGVQHGFGKQTWYLNRVPGSQYPLRNEYIGDFVNGLRHGHGKFFFASGAVYDGEWENNKKHGWGKFIFKNGKVFEGQFENDHMVNYPNFRLDGSGENTDGGNIRTRTPVGWEEVNNDAKSNEQLLGPSLSLDIDFILDELKEDQREEELKQVTSLVLRNVSVLRRVYSFYSALGHDRSPDNTFVMTRFQLWRFLKDCQIHLHNRSLSEMDRLTARCHDTTEVHNPMEKLLLREFLTTCVTLSYNIYKDEEIRNDAGSKKTGVLCRCLQRLIEEHIMKHSCQVGGHFLSEPRRAVCALAYMDKSWHIYQRVCSRRKMPPYESSFTMRQFLFLLKELKIIGSSLCTKDVLSILAADDPSVSDGDQCNLEVEMTFLEFFEALIGIAVNYVSTDTIRASFLSDQQRTRFSRPPSSSVQSVSEMLQAQNNPSYETFSQTDDERCGELEANKQSTGSVHGENVGGFLQTLSQLSVQDDVTQAREESPSVLQEEFHAPTESNPEENQFNEWSGKLEHFFSKLLFPSWNYLERVRAQVSKDRAEREEKERLLEIEKEAERRRKLLSEEIKPPSPEEEDPTQDTEPTPECGSAGAEFQVVEAYSSDNLSRPISSTTSTQNVKTGKGKKKKSNS